MAETQHAKVDASSTRLSAWAEAGRRGAGVRSDCWVRVELADEGGIRLTVRSKVESMYGDSIRQLARDVLAALGVQNATLELEDAGALPFVLMARIETAVRRLHKECGTGFQPVGLQPVEGTGTGAAPPSAAGAPPRPGAPSRCAARGGGLTDIGVGYLPDWGPSTQYPTSRDRFRRSRLYLPGNEPKFMLNAGLHGPDGVILDLEDSVAPPQKDAARVLVRNALRALDFHGAERMVRINQGTRGLEDLDFIAAHNVHVILIPKAESAEQVRAVDARIAEILAQSAAEQQQSELSDSKSEISNLKSQISDHKSQISDREPQVSDLQSDISDPKSEISNLQSQILLMPIIESALGVQRAYEIATASPNVCAVTIGLEDYTADIGTQRTLEGRESLWARCQVLNAARAAGVQPIDSVFSDVGDTNGLRASVLEAKSLGFEGKGCIHPRQIPVVHEAFAPAHDELEKAQRIVAAFAEAQAKGLGVVSLDGKMIDPPVVKRAQRIVRLAEAMWPGAIAL